LKLLIIEKIDDYDVITKIDSDNGMIDPEASRAAAASSIKKSQTSIEIDRLKSQMGVYARQRIQAERNALKAKTDADKRKFVDEYRLRQSQLKDVEEQLKPLAVAFQQEFRDAVRAKAVYFQPKPGNELVDDAEAEAIQTKLSAAIQAGVLLSRNLKQICDYRGRKFWKKISGKWQGQEISKIGIEPASGVIADVDLTEAQRAEISAQIETDRIAAMKTADRLAEKTAVLTALAGDGNAMRGRLEIQGDPDALKKSQDWYNAEAVTVEAKYK